MQATITIFPKKGVLDPQGKAAYKMLKQLGFNSVKDVYQGKIITIMLNENNREKALKDLHDMCRKLLVNDVMETYEINIKD